MFKQIKETYEILGIVIEARYELLLPAEPPATADDWDVDRYDMPKVRVDLFLPMDPDITPPALHRNILFRNVCCFDQLITSEVRWGTYADDSRYQYRTLVFIEPTIKEALKKAKERVRRDLEALNCSSASDTKLQRLREREKRMAAALVDNPFEVGDT